ncbi:hypothetical protein [Streptomyces olivochromogenes]|nr:hypothetical protein [Streptomyces olivochromogenes]
MDGAHHLQELADDRSVDTAIHRLGTNCNAHRLLADGHQMG